MLKNKIMVLAIGILSVAVVGNSQTLRTDAGPAEYPPKSFKGKQYVDSKGCVYIRAGYGTRITWVPRVNRERRVFCSPRNKPSLSPAQLAAISGKPATRLVKPTAKVTAPVKPAVPKTTVRTAAATPLPAPQVKPVAAKPAKKPTGLFGTNKPKRAKKVKPVQVVRTQPAAATPVIQQTTTVAVATPRKRRANTGIWGQRTTPQAQHPSDLFRQIGPTVQGGTNYNIAPTTGQVAATPTVQGGTAYNIAAVTPQRVRRKNSVRGFSLFDRRNNREALRTGPQAVHPADVIRAQQSGGTYQQAYGGGAVQTAARSTDPIHNLTLYPTSIASDVTARGDAQMAQVWTNTVPRKLVKKRRAKLYKSAMTYTASTKSRDYAQDTSMR